jgi:anti-sigma-K factor RskA
MSETKQWTEAEILELLPLYGLGALEPEEVVMIEKHLAAHPHLLAQVAETDHALVALAELAPYAALPVNAKERLLAVVQGENQPATQTGSLPIRPVVMPTDSAQPSFVTWLREVWQGKRIWQFAAATSFAALFILALYTANLSNQLDETGQQVATLEQEVTDLAQVNGELVENRDALAAALTTQIQLLQQDFNTNRELLASAQSDPSLLQAVINANNSVVLHNHVNSDLPRGVFYQSGHTGQLVVHGLNPLPADQAYQLWAVTQDGTQIPTGMVTVQDPAAATWTSITLPTTLTITDVVAIGISIEPASGSAAPTSPMLLDGEL